MQSDKTDSLLESIREELNAIINEGENEILPQNTPSISNPTKSKVATATKRPSLNGPTTSSTPKPSTPSGATKKKITSYIRPELAEQLAHTDKAKRADFLNDQMAKTIDENVQRMQVDLTESYELFQGINERFQNINFGNLKNRIKNLQLGAGAAANTADATADQVKEMFEKSYMEKRLHTITTDMSEKLRKHPGEFGDIPEVSEFFKACSQLQNGLKKLKKQRDDTNDLEKQLTWATEVSYERADEIRKAMTKNVESDVDDDNDGDDDGNGATAV